MQRISLILFCALCAGWVFGQQPQRSPEEEATKQTTMICRELNITDSVQMLQLYDMHLKYAEMRQISNTRLEALERLQQINEDLKSILTAEQYDQFMNKQVHTTSRPQLPYGTMPSIPVQPSQCQSIDPQ